MRNIYLEVEEHFAKLEKHREKDLHERIEMILDELSEVQQESDMEDASKATMRIRLLHISAMAVRAVCDLGL